MAELSRAIARLMQERDRAQQPAQAPTDAPKLRDVIEHLRSRVPPGERALAEALARQLFDKSGADLLEQEPVLTLVGVTLSIFRFVMETSPDEPRVTIRSGVVDDSGWEIPGIVIQTLMRDRPFIVDTVQDCLHQAGCTIQRLLHPIFNIERDGRGNLRAIVGANEPGRSESIIHVEVDRVADAEALSAELTQRLSDVVLVTDDYQAMRNKAEEIADELRSRPLPRPWNEEAEEVAAFLDWLGQKNFVFLGYREYQISGQRSERSVAMRPGSGRGILRHESRSQLAQARTLPDTVRRQLNEPPLYVLSKTNAESPVHRRAHMDYVGIKEVDGSGVVVGERRFLGLFTARAYAEEPLRVPLLRQKLAMILEAEGASEGSHSYRQIVAAFNSLPRVELLASNVDALHSTVKAILAAQGGSEIRVLEHPGPLARGAFVVVIVPKERFSDELYRLIEVTLSQALGAAAVLERRLAFDDSDQVRMHFYFVPGREGLRSIVAAELQAIVNALLRTWDDRLRDALAQQLPRDQARPIAARYATAFSPQYKAATDIAIAVRDITNLEALLATRTPQVDLVNPTGATTDDRFTALQLYLIDEDLVLSDFLPVLENLGLRVFSQDPTDLKIADAGAVRIHTFLVQDRKGARLDPETAAPLLRPALLMLHRRRIESDALNALILSAGLEWRAVDVLRTYVNHGVQIGSAPSRGAIINALLTHPPSARLLWEYFDTKFSPLAPAAPRERARSILPEIATRFVASLDAVDSAVDDRILRALFSAIAATLRTNCYRPAPETGAAPGGALAIKLDCREIAHLPQPQPVYEIYVHHPDVEGLHLRGAKVARGGIRLSDRPDDFRTEVLGLMRTQMVKNAVIVPAGAKGGFIVKRRAGVAPSASQVVAAYRTFIGALLDLTDNIVQGRVDPPPGVLLYDDLDPYLVVAADKGTATFSDVANDLGAQRRFWLGDAFASGGSHGYDHKREGITARGAWECVRRHFIELGLDVDREPIDVIGIGDMSGDVFGNGVLLSRQFRLRAAFNHQHIFLDPDPDPARSYTERERLFHLPRSSWTDYNPQLISEGGGVSPRHAKRVSLAPAARNMLGIPDGPSGEELVRAILRMEADLLWNGGVGTYVKASDETPAAVGDSSNDNVRVDASELRVKVVAEGGNLGITQRGRVEYALRGGRLNTDAIDNSGGVDMSDHEVNIKIALAGAMEAGQLRPSDRDQILTDLTPEVTQRVLAHNRRQARVLSLDQRRSQTRLSEFREHVTQLESAGQLDRHVEHLPDRDALRNRRGVFLGLTRPELAVLLAHTKLSLQQQLLASPLPDDPYLEALLRGYFPELLNTRFGHGIRSHRLRREIIAVEAANLLVDTMGMTFVTRVRRDTGVGGAAVVRAWNIVMDVTGVSALWSELADAQPPLPVTAEARCWFALEDAVERATKWLIETQPGDVPMGEMVLALSEPADELMRLLPVVLPSTSQAAAVLGVESFAAEGTPRPLAQRILAFDRLAELFEIAEIAAGLEVTRSQVAEIYYRVGDLVDLDWLRQAINELPGEDRWERRAVEELNQSLVAVRRQVTQEMLQQPPDSVDACLAQFADAHQAGLAKVGALINDIKGGRHATLAGLLVVMRELGRLVGQAV